MFSPGGMPPPWAFRPSVSNALTLRAYGIPWYVYQPVGKPMGSSSFMTRLKDWWEGYETIEVAKDAEPSDETTSEEEAETEVWHPSRVEAAQLLFGIGLMTPGAEAAMQKLIKPLGINEAHTVIELGTGLGALTRYIASETGAWVTGYEESEFLVEVGREISAEAGLAKKADIRQSPLLEVPVKPKSAYAVISKEALYTVEDKNAMLEKMHDMLRPGGQLTFTDFYADKDAGKATEHWKATEAKPVFLSQLDTVIAKLKALRFDVRVSEDITAEYIEQIREAFANMAVELESRGELEPDLSRSLMGEVKNWNKRLLMLQSGEVSLYRIYAFLPNEVS